VATKLDENDVFVFFFSGHGTTSGDVSPFDELDGLDEYLVTHNFENIRDDELGDWFAALPTDNYIVLLDSCFAGGSAQGTLVPKGLGDDVPAPGDGFAADLIERAGPDKDLDENNAGVVLSACAEGQVAWESNELYHGVFTYYLLQGMRGKADQEGNADEWVSAEECYEYLAPRVNSWALDAGITQGQNPQLYDADPGTDIDFVSIETVVYEPSTWTVPGDFPNIQNAINAAKEGDVIILSTGVYFGGDSVSPGQVIIDKEVTITSTNPDDPDIVEATVINCAGYASRGVYFTANAGPGAVLAGITIANGTWYVIDADDGEQPSST